jgi:hypothetical protein
MPQFMLSSSSAQAPLRVLDARPDDTDAKDYIFQPSLTQLPDKVDNSGDAPVLDQNVEGACVGFALATVINVCQNLHYRRRPVKEKKPEPVSYRMLYEMARRYDEWQGENYEGTSLRGAMKGWHQHGVASAESWPYESKRNGRAIPDRAFTLERAQDALRRPLGAYYRILDSDVSHMQAALAEADAVLASAWIHPGWQDDRLISKGQNGLKRIPAQTGKIGLHAFAIVGYTADGFIVQNSWGEDWGSGGYALLSYEDWFENRQDAWVARTGPETRDSHGEPKIFLTGFAGGAAMKTSMAGLNLESGVRLHLINTGDKGALSKDGRLHTDPQDLPQMARQVLTSPVLNDNCHHIVLYAHGGLNNEEYAASVAERLWSNCLEKRLHPYFFIWESGKGESVAGWLRSDDDASGPARFNWGDAWDSIKKGTSKLVREAQHTMGDKLAPVVREVFWDEMKGRAEGASTQRGGASLFTTELFKAMGQTAGENYKIHLVGHSAGSIYLGCLYQNMLCNLLPDYQNVTLQSIHFLAPAITIERAREAFISDGQPAVPKQRFHIHTLTDAQEANDNIVIYPSSLLTYVADHLEDADRRVPLFGIRNDFESEIDFATRFDSRNSWRHGQFDDKGHEIEDVLKMIATLEV